MGGVQGRQPPRPPAVAARRNLCDDGLMGSAESAGVARGGDVAGDLSAVMSGETGCVFDRCVVHVPTLRLSP